MDENHDESPSVNPVYKSGTSFKTTEKLENVYEMENEEATGEQMPQNSSSSVRKTLLGLLIVVFLAVSWVGAQQFAQSAVLSENFSAPFFTTWFGTCWMIMCYPIYCLYIFVSKSRINFCDAVKDSLLIFGPEAVTPRQTMTIVLPFNVLWIATNYLYTFALTYIAATDASAIISSNVAFVYTFSFFLLGEKMYFIRIGASLMCISGVVLFGYADGFGETGNLAPGIIMAVFSALGAATYKVFFKKVVGDGSLGQVSLFLSLLGFTNAIFLWIIFIILYFTGVESFTAADIPWNYLCGSSALSLVFNFLVNFGIAFTYPLFISIAMMLGIPINAAVDLLLRGVMFSALRLVAAFLVVLGFCLMMCPDQWNLPIHRFLGCRWRRCYDGSAEQEDDEAPIAYSSGNLKRENNASNREDEA